MVFHNGSYRITVRAPFANFIMAAIIATVYGDYLATPKQFGIMRGNPKNEAFPGGWYLPAQIPSGQERLEVLPAKHGAGYFPECPAERFPELPAR